MFTGREWLKGLKLYGYRNRMDNHALGRFKQPDPKQFEAGECNLYPYCHNTQRVAYVQSLCQHGPQVAST